LVEHTFRDFQYLRDLLNLRTATTRIGNIVHPCRRTGLRGILHSAELITLSSNFMLLVFFGSDIIVTESSFKLAAEHTGKSVGASLIIGTGGNKSS
jgi:hypothetical protein